MADFIWGAGGTRMTPEEIASQRKVAQALMAKGMDYSPIQSPWQGAARIAQALLGGWESGQADAAAKVNSDAETKLMDQYFGSTNPAASASPMGATAMPGAPVQTMAMPGATATGPVVPNDDNAIPGTVGMNQALADRSQDFIQDNPGTYLSSGVRSTADQARLYADRANNPNPVAVPGTSRHERGMAVDIGGMSPVTRALLPQYGLAQPVANDPPHVELAPNVQVASNDPAALPVNAQATQGFAIPGQAAPAAAPSRGINPAILQLVTSPYASDSAKKIGGLLFQSALDQQAKANDPKRALEIQEMQGRISAQPLDLQGKRLANMKAERELQGEGAQPLTADERAQYGIPSGQPAYKTRSGEIKFGPAGTKITNNVGADETAFDKEAGKVQAQRFNDLIGEGQQAKQMVADISTLTDLGKSISTGKGAQVRAALGPFAEAVGAKIEGLSDIQAFNSIVNRMAPALRVKGSGSQSDTELRNFLMSLPSLGNTSEGNAIIGTVMTGLQQNKILAAEIGSKALNKEISRSEAEKQLRNLPDPMQPYRSYRKQRSNIENIMKKYGG